MPVTELEELEINDQPTITLVQDKMLSSVGEKQPTKLVIMSIFEKKDVDRTDRQPITLKDRCLRDIEFTTGIDGVYDLRSETKTLINPNTIILIDEQPDN